MLPMIRTVRGARDPRTDYKAARKIGGIVRTVAEPKTRAWNDLEWRDRYRHIVSDDEHAADMLAEVFAEIDHRHPYALCGVSLVCLEPNPSVARAQGGCPECLQLSDGDIDGPREAVPYRMRPSPQSTGS